MFKFDKNKLILILFGSLLISLLYNTFSQNGISLIREKTNYKMVSASETVNDEQIEIKIIDEMMFIDWFYNEDIKIIDARDEWDFAEGHIEHAINVPNYNFEPDSIKNKNLSFDDKIVVYCSASDCDISKKLSEKLKLIGFRNLYVFEKGYEVWQKAGFPIKEGGQNDE